MTRAWRSSGASAIWRTRISLVTKTSLLSSQKIADLKRDTGEIGTALSLCEELIVAARCLAATHPDTAEGRLILSVSLEDVAVIKVRCDNRAGALELYSESLILR